MAIKNTVTYRGTDPASDKQFSIRGTGNVRATALAEANAKLALTVMVVDRGTETAELPVGDLGAAAAGVSADGVLVLTKGVGFTDKTIRFENMTVAVKKAGTKGKIDGLNQLILDFIAAYVDGDGFNGYQFLDGDLLV